MIPESVTPSSASLRPRRFLSLPSGPRIAMISDLLSSNLGTKHRRYVTFVGLARKGYGCIVARVGTRLSRAGLSVIRYALPGKITSHLMGAEGRTVCGVKARGSRWKKGDTFNPEHDCKRCARRVREGVARVLSYCPKCALDLNARVALLPNRKCGNCGLEWK